MMSSSKWKKLKSFKEIWDKIKHLIIEKLTMIVFILYMVTFALAIFYVESTLLLKI